jgi:hypothetical protein
MPSACARDKRPADSRAKRRCQQHQHKRVLGEVVCPSQRRTGRSVVAASELTVEGLSQVVVHQLIQSTTGLSELVGEQPQPASERDYAGRGHKRTLALVKIFSTFPCYRSGVERSTNP